MKKIKMKSIAILLIIIGLVFPTSLATKFLPATIDKTINHYDKPITANYSPVQLYL